MFQFEATVRVPDGIRKMIARKVADACVAAADVLAVEYFKALTYAIAPPHSSPGEIPHAYAGWREGGFGPVNDDTTINNTPRQGFAKNQEYFLAAYIRSARSSTGGSVGFTPSHVRDRFMNYLLGWDQGMILGQQVPVRPWVKPVYQRSQGLMIQAVRESLK